MSYGHKYRMLYYVPKFPVGSEKIMIEIERWIFQIQDFHNFTIVCQGN